jgi:OOP family OmpA-OmpF porin
MRTPSIQKRAALGVAVLLALGIFSVTSSAQVRDPGEHALLLDMRGAPVMSSTGLCWHTAYGPAPAWIAGCHAVPVAQLVPIAAAPASAATVPAAPLPVYEKVAFDANVLFGSNQSALSLAGRDALDSFVGSIHGLESRTVIATGHADRMGSEAANQMLSEERVNAVKSYLVGKGVAADRVQTSAWGETRPATSAGACAEANTGKNVACLQADRHVTVQISGSRLAR